MRSSSAAEESCEMAESWYRSSILVWNLRSAVSRSHSYYLIKSRLPSWSGQLYKTQFRKPLPNYNVHTLINAKLICFNMQETDEMLKMQSGKHAALSLMVSSAGFSCSSLCTSFKEREEGIYLVKYMSNLLFSLNSTAAALKEKLNLSTSAPLSCSPRVLSTAAVQK